MPFPYAFPLTFEDEWRVLVDWDADGDWYDQGSEVTPRVRGRQGIKLVRGRDQVRALAPPMAGSLALVLDNTSRDYSPETPASPLAGYLIPGRPVRVERDQGANRYYLFAGRVDGLIQHPEPGVRTVEIRALGALSRLKGVKLSTPLYQDVRTDQALGYLLDAAGVEASLRVLDVGRTTLAWWWLDAEDALEAAVALVNTEGPGASLYEDGQGRIRFESRHYRLLTPRSTTSQATIRDAGLEPLHSQPFAYDPGLKSIVNECVVDVRVRSAKSLGAIWSLGEAVSLAPDETRRFVVRHGEGDPFLGAVNPVAGVDYTLTAGSLASATLDRTSGASATLTLTAGAGGASLTGLQVRAQLVSVDSSTRIRNTIDTAASQQRYGVRSYKLATRAEIPANAAQDFADAVVSRYREPRPTVLVTLRGDEPARVEQALAREVSDRITVVEAQTGLNADCWVERVERVISETGQVEARFGCEKATDDQYATWGTTRWSDAAGTTPGRGLWGY